MDDTGQHLHTESLAERRAHPGAAVEDAGRIVLVARRSLEPVLIDRDLPEVAAAMAAFDHLSAALGQLQAVLPL
jgi:hypothetical protein